MKLPQILRREETKKIEEENKITQEFIKEYQALCLKYKRDVVAALQIITIKSKLDADGNIINSNFNKSVV
jgi:hypothetical protein